jgi:hypothetical protein
MKPLPWISPKSVLPWMTTTAGDTRFAIWAVVSDTCPNAMGTASTDANTNFSKRQPLPNVPLAELVPTPMWSSCYALRCVVTSGRVHWLFEPHGRNDPSEMQDQLFWLIIGASGMRCAFPSPSVLFIFSFDFGKGRLQKGYGAF